MISAKHKEYRVIWTLADGRMIYSCKRDWPELWSLEEIEKLIEQRPKGFGCYTPGFELYFPDMDVARNLCPPERQDGLVLITGYLIQRGTQKVNEAWLPSALASVGRDDEK